MKVWITGAGGMMGSHLAEMLLAAGHDVYATYCRPTIDPSDLQFNGAEVDITDWCSVYDSIATFRPDAVFHLAAQSYPAVSWARPVETLTTNMVGTAIVFEALRRVRPHAKIIVAGSSAEYGFVDPSEVPINERRELRRSIRMVFLRRPPTCWRINITSLTACTPSSLVSSIAPGHAKSEMHFPISSAVVHGWSTIRNKVPSGWEILRRNGLSWTSAISIGR
ncbi:GDP-mannose 4,6-dehydratase Gca [Mycobacterium tuberculosis M2416]|nr:GDP-mannose 4,6-dehydratase Gca [Mycobacterium tuberculosis M2343]KBD92548.1 GDP-mannose 4,6-dehydratase Gca [Mycobacterium tuberculosis M2416]KBF28310.1 GDP-mannose 4,6-dehydratase Gca [Mycobacterium tuberculosis H3367]